MYEVLALILFFDVYRAFFSNCFYAFLLLVASYNWL